METLRKGKLAKGSLSITGSSVATGGVYETIRIVGEGVIDGDTECGTLKCTGTLDMEGRLKAKRIGVVGTCTFSNDVSSDAMKISGTASIGGDASLKELRCSGTMEIRGSLQSERLEIKGELETQGDCEAELFVSQGIFNIGGLLNAGRMDIKLYRDCQAKEIGGENIKVRRASMLNPFSFFFRPSPHAQLSAALIEGDDIYLEHTTAKVVRGSRITLGPGCSVELVEYKEHLEMGKGAHVSEKRKV
jgi:cytoskeletal protein CcmA (bactofilin family)